MKFRPLALFLILIALASPVFPQGQGSGANQQFIRVRSKVVVLKNVRIIDGTGGPAKENQTITLIGDRIGSILPADSAPAPADAQVLELAGYTVIPGLVGMHNHMFFPQGGQPSHYSNMAISFPRLYLALGVTTVRTTGSVSPNNDLEVKRRIDSGQMIGPKMHVTAPYLEGKGAFTPVMHELTGVEDARIDANGDQLPGFFPERRPTHTAHGRQLPRRRIRNIREINLSTRTPHALGGSPAAR